MPRTLSRTLLAFSLTAAWCCAEDALTLLPAETDWVLGADLERIVATPSFAGWEAERQRAAPPDDFIEFLSRSGLDLRRDVKSMLAGGQLGGSPGAPGELVVVLEGRFDPAALLPAWSERYKLTDRNVEGLRFYRPARIGAEAAALAGHELEFAFLNSHRLLLCSAGAVPAVAALAGSRGPGLAADQEMRGLIDEVRGGAMLWIAGRLQPEAESALATNPFASGLRTVRTFGFTLDLENGLRADLRLRCADDTQAGPVFETVSGLVALGRGLLSAQSPEAARALAGLKADRQGAAVTLSLVLDRAALDAVQQSFKKPAASLPR